MKLKKPVSGKILRHSKGMGVPTRETVEQRARELALIAGRESFSEGDWQQAFRELHGGAGESIAAESEMMASYSQHDSVSPSLGHQTGRLGGEERSIAEELVAEGLDEAEHDQMLASRREIDLPLDDEAE